MDEDNHEEYQPFLPTELLQEISEKIDDYKTYINAVTASKEMLNLKEYKKRHAQQIKKSPFWKGIFAKPFYPDVELMHKQDYEYDLCKNGMIVFYNHGFARRIIPDLKNTEHYWCGYVYLKDTLWENCKDLDQINLIFKNGIMQHVDVHEILNGITFSYLGFLCDKFVLGWDHSGIQHFRDYITLDMIENEINYVGHLIRKIPPVSNAFLT